MVPECSEGGLDRTAQETWTRFYQARYLSEARTYPQGSRCPTCGTAKDCNNHFCVLCKVGGLCPSTFRDDGEHKTHPWIQVRHYSRKPSVIENDLGCFIYLECLAYIQKHLLNGRDHLFLRSRNTTEPWNADESRYDGASSSRRLRKSKLERCLSCKTLLRGSQNSKESFMVCSLQCLVQIAAQNPKWNLLHMNDEKLHPKSRPMLAQEKFNMKPEDPSAKNLVYLALLFNSKPSGGPVAVGPPPVAAEAPPMAMPDAASGSATDDAAQAPLAPVAAPPAPLAVAPGPMAVVVPDRPRALPGQAGGMFAEVAVLIEAFKVCGDWEKYLGSSGWD